MLRIIFKKYIIAVSLMIFMSVPPIQGADNRSAGADFCQRLSQLCMRRTPIKRFDNAAHNNNEQSIVLEISTLACPVSPPPVVLAEEETPSDAIEEFKNQHDEQLTIPTQQDVSDTNAPQDNRTYSISPLSDIDRALSPAEKDPLVANRVNSRLSQASPTPENEPPFIAHDLNEAIAQLKKYPRSAKASVLVYPPRQQQNLKAQIYKALNQD